MEREPRRVAVHEFGAEVDERRPVAVAGAAVAVAAAARALVAQRRRAQPAAGRGGVGLEHGDVARREPVHVAQRGRALQPGRAAADDDDAPRLVRGRAGRGRRRARRRRAAAAARSAARPSRRAGLRAPLRGGDCRAAPSGGGGSTERVLDEEPQSHAASASSICTILVDEGDGDGAENLQFSTAYIP